MAKSISHPKTSLRAFVILAANGPRNRNLLQMMSAPSYPLFCIGNPLLDIQVRDGEKLLEKYNLKANDAILAGDERMPM